MRERARITMLAVVAGIIQRNRAEKKEEKVEECRKEQLGGMSLAVVGNDWEECKTSWER
jgi:hypothetical protein